MGAVYEMLIAFLCAALSGMGVGGGGLLLIYLTMFTDSGRQRAQMYNLLFFMCASAASLLIHADKRKIDLRVTALISAAGIPGAVLGAALSGASGDDAIGILIGAFLFVSGAVSLFSKRKQK